MASATPKEYLERIGFVLSYPLSDTNNLDNKLAIQFNKLLAKLNHKFPDYFPASVYKDYLITTAYTNDKNLHQENNLIVSNEKNLLRLKEEFNNLEFIICFGEKAYFAAQKVKEVYDLKYKVIKTKSFAYPVSRHIKTLYNNNNNKHFRANFHVLTQFNDIDKQFSEKKRFK